MSDIDKIEADLDTLEIWARKHATSLTRRFDEQAEAAQIVLEMIEMDRIGHDA